MSHFYCYTCKEVHADFDMVPYGIHNPDIPGTENFLGCPCGEREDVTEDVYECAGCEERFPGERIESGSDLCIECYQAEHGPH